LVSGSTGENVLRVEGSTAAEAWKPVRQAAEGAGMFRRGRIATADGRSAHSSHQIALALQIGNEIITPRVNRPLIELSFPCKVESRNCEAAIMDVEFADENLRQLYTNSNSKAGYGIEIIRSFRKKMQLLVSAGDERDLRAWNSLHYKQLKGDRKHQWTIRLNGPWRLVLEKRIVGNSTTLVVVAIENEH
jgi:proteic killer suppression protein